MSLQLIKLQFDEKQLRKMKFDEENEAMRTLRQNEEALNLELNKIKLENESLLSVGKKQEEEFMKLKREYDELFKENETFEIELFKLKQQLEVKTVSLNECLVKIKLLAEQCKEEQLLKRKCLDFENEIDVLKKNYKNLEIENNRKDERIKEFQQKETFKVFFVCLFITLLDTHTNLFIGFAVFFNAIIRNKFFS